MFTSWSSNVWYILTDIDQEFDWYILFDDLSIDEKFWIIYILPYDNNINLPKKEINVKPQYDKLESGSQYKKTIFLQNQFVKIVTFKVFRQEIKRAVLVSHQIIIQTELYFFFENDEKPMIKSI